MAKKTKIGLVHTHIFKKGAVIPFILGDCLLGVTGISPWRVHTLAFWLLFGIKELTLRMDARPLLPMPFMAP